MDRLDAIEAKAAHVPIKRVGSYAWGDDVSRFLTTETFDRLQELLTEDIPWLIAEVRAAQGNMRHAQQQSRS